MGFHQPAYYRIYVLGDIDMCWITDYYDLGSNYETHTHQPNITVVSGELVDQSALLGILSLMNDSGLHLLGFDCFPYRSE